MMGKKCIPAPETVNPTAGRALCLLAAAALSLAGAGCRDSLRESASPSSASQDAATSPGETLRRPSPVLTIAGIEEAPTRFLAPPGRLQPQDLKGIGLQEPAEEIPLLWKNLQENGIITRDGTISPLDQTAPTSTLPSQEASPDTEFLIPPEQLRPHLPPNIRPAASALSRRLSKAKRKGLPRGIDVDIFRRIMEGMGIHRYQIIIENSSSRLENNWKDGRIYDMVFSYSYKEARTQHLLYPEESHLTISWHFFIRREDAGTIEYIDYSDLSGLIIGATRGFSYTDTFWNAAESGLLTLDIVPSNNLQMNKLIRGRIDVLPYNTFAGLYKAQREGRADQITYLPKPIKSKPYYNTFVRKADYPEIQALIPRYDQALRELKKEGFLQEIYQTYGIR